MSGPRIDKPAGSSPRLQPHVHYGPENLQVALRVQGPHHARENQLLHDGKRNRSYRSNMGFQNRWQRTNISGEDDPDWVRLFGFLAASLLTALTAIGALAFAPVARVPFLYVF